MSIKVLKTLNSVESRNFDNIEDLTSTIIYIRRKLMV